MPEKANPLIPSPPDLFQPERKNSLGLPIWEDLVREPLLAAMERALADPASANPIVSGHEVEEGGEVGWITSPHDRRVVVGVYRSAGPEAIDKALAAAQAASEDWDRRGGEARAALLDRAADLFEADRPALMALLVREAGKTLQNAQSDLREAVDHLRYSAAQARFKFAAPRILKGPTGEENVLAAWARRIRLHLALGTPASPSLPGRSPARPPPATRSAKPAEQTPLVAARAVRLLHRAGIPPGCAASSAGTRR